MSDLDNRLRRALRLPAEPGTTEAARSSVVSALPRYRARRRMRVATLGASLLGVVGLAATAIAVGTAGSPSPRVAAPAQRISAPSTSASCVEVRVGSGPLDCEGLPASGSGTENSALAAPAFEPAVPSGSAPTVRAQAGSAVEVSLPKASGVNWTGVLVKRVGGPTLRVAIHLHRSSGRVIAVLTAPPPGTYELSATGVTVCRPAAACTPLAEGWAVTLVVV